MTDIAALTAAITALPAAITAAGDAVTTQLTILNAQIAALTAAQVPQATIDDLTAQVNAAIVSIEAITDLATP